MNAHLEFSEGNNGLMVSKRFRKITLADPKKVKVMPNVRYLCLLDEKENHYKVTDARPLTGNIEFDDTGLSGSVRFTYANRKVITMDRSYSGQLWGVSIYDDEEVWTYDFSFHDIESINNIFTVLNKEKCINSSELLKEFNGFVAKHMKSETIWLKPGQNYHQREVKGDIKCNSKVTIVPVNYDAYIVKEVLQEDTASINVNEVDGYFHLNVKADSLGDSTLEYLMHNHTADSLISILTSICAFKNMDEIAEEIKNQYKTMERTLLKRHKINVEVIDEDVPAGMILILHYYKKDNKTYGVFNKTKIPSDAEYLFALPVNYKRKNGVTF